MKAYLDKVLNYENLTEFEMIGAMEDIVDGRATDSQIASFLTALKMKGESLDEIVGAAKLMRERARPLEIDYMNSVDTCGTGGDGKNTFNISTVSSFVSAPYVPIMKHGNRSVSSKCGSADVLERLGVKVDGSLDFVRASMDKLNMAFLFAPNYHKAMKSVVGIREELSTRTIFNILGPLINPANPKGQLMGVYKEDLTDKVAYVLKELKLKRAMVVHGLDGLDEISITRGTKVSELKDGQVKNYFLDPQDYGMAYGSLEDIRGGDSYENSRILLNILRGERGARRDIVLLNSAASIYVGGGASSLEEGLRLAKRSIDQGLALEKLEGLVKLSGEFCHAD